MTRTRVWEAVPRHPRSAGTRITDDGSGVRVDKTTNELLAAARRLSDTAAVVVGTPGTAARLREALAR